MTAFEFVQWVLAVFVLAVAGLILAAMSAGFVRSFRRGRRG
ncbi:hypothetical protein BKA24_001669 [Microbacterium marinum]|uniref:Uncharacterized protein n=1 Tax=Microbacterium marinum TaxID=421115 RepID=A0A7W7BQK7_9MICO|nr:hypothetical protein [Microbacterium marinum]MBB4666960.1 hypothetical protein [Microbacterium marinum]